MATIKQVAAHAGVSSATVSHVINNTRFVSAEVRYLVEQAMDALDYRPNALARSLRRGHTNTLGLILPDSANPFFADIGRSIERAAFSAGYNIILCNTENDFKKESLYIDVLTNKQVDGLIFVSTGEQENAVNTLSSIDLPLVVMDRDFPDLALNVVLVDNLQGGCMAARHLLELGHNRIACITGPSHLTPSALRVTGYTRYLEEAGLPIDPALITGGDFHPQSGLEAAYRLLNLPQPPTAIFACNDLMATGVLRAASELGLRVPQDLALVGYDDIEFASFTNPPLTTIKQPIADMGQIAIQFLLNRINDRQIPPQSKLLTPDLIIRGSCGGAPEAYPSKGWFNNDEK